MPLTGDGRKQVKKATTRSADGKAEDVLGAPSSRYFVRARQRARRILDDPEQLRHVAEEAARTGAHSAGPFEAVVGDFKALIRLVVAYSRGHYREIALDELALIVAGLIYVVSPIDLIPDLLPGGLLDDAVVIGWIIKAVHDELNDFRDWEEGRTT